MRQLAICYTPSWWGYLRYLWCFLLVAGLVGCPGEQAPQVEPGGAWLAQASPLTLADDLDRESLQQALLRSLQYIERLPAERSLPFGGRQIPVGAVQETLQTFQHLLATTSTIEALQDAVSEQFDVFQAAGRESRGDVLFTGYYEMVLEGSLSSSAVFPYPLYVRPPDLLDIDLGKFHARYKGERIIARYDHGAVVPYFTRREIDEEGKLQGQGLELLWLRDPVDRFFLHIQGSGQIQLADGQIRRVNYAASNGQSYESIGRVLIEAGQVPKEGMSLQSLRRYFRDKPEERLPLLSRNPRYIFFREVPQGPQGALGLILVPGRSIATDLRLFPPAGLAFIEAQKPVLDPQGKIVAWEPCRRFVLNQDTGSAITGPGRVDLFWGSGLEAETAAGHIKHQGKLFFLLKKGHL